MMVRTGFLLATLLSVSFAASATAFPQEAPSETALTLAADDVIPTGNDWIALPSTRAQNDAALVDFNVISMRYRGLIEFARASRQPLMKPFLSVAGVKRQARRPCGPSLRDYWLPTGTMEAAGCEPAFPTLCPRIVARRSFGFR